MTTDIKDRLRDKAATMDAVDFVICAKLYRDAADYIEQQQIEIGTLRHGSRLANDARSDLEAKLSAQSDGVFLSRATLIEMDSRMRMAESHSGGKIDTNSIRECVFPPDECDCENPEPESGAALISNECPIHNLNPSLSPKESGDICASCHTWADCSKAGECDHHGYPLRRQQPTRSTGADTIDYYLPATRTKPAQQFTMRLVPDVEIAMLADQAGLPFGPDFFALIKRFSIALSAAAIAANAKFDSPALSNALDLYEAQTKALPFGHEIRDRGYSAYNWQMAAIRDIRALIKERP